MKRIRIQFRVSHEKFITIHVLSLSWMTCAAGYNNATVEPRYNELYYNKVPEITR